MQPDNEGSAAAGRPILAQDWGMARWGWLDAIRREPGLKPSAKVLASALVHFANHKTAFCNPSVETLADAIGLKVRATQKALAELRQAGWVTMQHLGRGKTSCFVFVLPGAVDVQKVVTLGACSESGSERVHGDAPHSPERVHAEVQKGARSCVPPCTPNIAKPSMNHLARGSEGATADRPSPQCRVIVRPGSHNEQAWDRHLRERQLPPLRALGLRSEIAGEWGWELPFALPPRPDEVTAMRITERWLGWALDGGRDGSARVAHQGGRAWA